MLDSQSHLRLVTPDRRSRTEDSSEVHHIEIAGDAPWPRVPDARYQLRYLRNEPFTAFGKANKLGLWFAIAEPGPFFGVELARFYNIDPPRSDKDRKRRAGHRRDLYLDYVRLFGSVPRGHIPLEPFKTYPLIGTTRTVTKSTRTKGGLALPELLHYSVIGRLDIFKP